LFLHIFDNGTDTDVSQNVFFCFPNVVWDSASGAFRIVSDKLVFVATQTNNIDIVNYGRAQFEFDLYLALLLRNVVRSLLQNIDHVKML